LAYANQKRRVSAECVEQAWADLQQLPTPWNSGQNTADTSKGDCIEFGSLDADDAPAPPAAPPPSPPPVLRITKQEEDGQTPLEPAEQIERIESTLASLEEEEFHPAGSIGPEVELVFTDPSNPFDEQFAEEEEVVDRYGDETSAQPGLTEPSPPLEVKPVAGCLDPSSEMVASVESVVWPKQFEMSAELAAATPVGDSSDLITVEDQYDEVQVAVHPVAPVRHQEYRRLFARLRHG
jgi:hypothetical protein